MELHKDSSPEAKKSVVESSRLRRLDPFIDEEGTLRVGGRLKYSSLLYGVKHPVILPRKSHVTTLIIKHFHERVKHQGKGITMNEIRSNGFWIVGCSQAVSSHIFQCVTCRRLRSSISEQKMADLPEDRTEPPPPVHCGVDCFGPFYTREGRKEHKRYGLLFTCMASRAVHIEILEDMTTDAFINALRCFIALRGAVKQLRSDQGSNFIGAQHELKNALNEVKNERIKAFLAEQGCDFLMNVPHASHMGGVWERQIRTIRNVLNTIWHQFAGRLDSASLRTFFYEAMAIVNGRPLTVENLGDPCGPEPLTPNHLLTMKSKVILPPPGDFVKEDVYARKRWRQVQYLSNEFWARWRKEYLANLQVRQKWNNSRRNLKVEDVVLIKDAELARGQWRLGQVVEVYPDKDQLVRKVRLRVGDPTLDKLGRRIAKVTYVERPIQKLVLLLESD